MLTSASLKSAISRPAFDQLLTHDGALPSANYNAKHAKCIRFTGAGLSPREVRSSTGAPQRFVTSGKRNLLVIPNIKHLCGTPVGTTRCLKAPLAPPSVPPPEKSCTMRTEARTIRSMLSAVLILVFKLKNLDGYGDPDSSQ